MQGEAILHGVVSRLLAVLLRNFDVLYVARHVIRAALHLLISFWILRT